MKRKLISQPRKMTLTRRLISIADFQRWLGRPMRSFEINLVRYFESFRQRSQLILAHVYDRPGSPSSVPIILAYVEWLRHCNPTDLPSCFIGKTRQAMKDLCSHHVRKPYQTGSYRAIDNLRGGTYMIAVCFDAPHDYRKVIPVLAPIFSSEFMRGAWIFHSVGIPKRNENTPYYISRFNADFPPPPPDLRRDSATETLGLPPPTVLYNDTPQGGDSPDPPGNCALRISHYALPSGKPLV